MKYFILSISLSFVFACNPIERISTPGEIVKIYPIGENGLWGYADENGNTIIDIQFEEAQFFVSGLAPVKQNGKYGYINKHGKFEIKAKYDSVEIMRYDFAFVNKNGKRFQIDRNGKRLRGKKMRSSILSSCGAPSYATNPLEIFEKSDNGYSLREEHFEAQKRYDPLANYTLEDFTFDEVIPYSSRTILVRRGDKYGFFVHYNGVGLSSLWVDDIILKYPRPIYQEKYASIIYSIVKQGDHWGLMQSMGKIVLEPEFISMRQMNGIMFMVEYEPQKFGCITAGNKRYF